MEIKKGFWNGGVDAITYQIVEYKVLEPEVKTWWMARFVGTIRQGILVKSVQSGHEFLIDNEHADGYCKIAGGGSPTHSHKSVDNYEIVNFDVPIEKINYRLNVEALRRDDKDHQEWMKINHPESYEKSMRLREGLKAHLEKYK